MFSFVQKHYQLISHCSDPWINLWQTSSSVSSLVFHTTSDSLQRTLSEFLQTDCACSIPTRRRGRPVKWPTHFTQRKRKWRPWKQCPALEIVLINFLCPLRSNTSVGGIFENCMRAAARICGGLPGKSNNGGIDLINTTTNLTASSNKYGCSLIFVKYWNSPLLCLSVRVPRPRVRSSELGGH